MAIEVGNNSSYVIPVDASSDNDTALSYSRHYAKKIHDLGKTSRETWIQTLVDHVLHGPGTKRPTYRGGGVNQDKRTPDAYETSPKMSQRKKQDHSVAFDLAGATSRRDGRIMNSLQNSPYLPKTKIGQENTMYLRKIVQTRDPGKLSSRSRESLESRRQKENLDNSDTQSNSSSVKSHHYPPIKSAPAFKENKVRFIPQELAQSPYVSHRNSYSIVPLEKILGKVKKQQRTQSQGGARLRKSDPAPRTANPYLSGNIHSNTHQSSPYAGPARAEAWKPPSLPNNAEMLALEKRAKSAAATAIKENKIFTCEGPYPVDAYVRFSLRKRGWVEKFGPKIHSTIVNGKGTSSKLECEFDEDFDIICDRNIPAPWEEEHGIYAMMSRLVRHRPARFIWAGRVVNTMVLNQDVIVNHFPKARTFSSKTGIANSLRDLPWLASSDPHDFFPRCYLLSEDERDDLIDDFRLTSCISLLKWVMQMFTTEETKEKVILPERSKTIEIIHEEEEDVSRKGEDQIVKPPSGEHSTDEEATQGKENESPETNEAGGKGEDASDPEDIENNNFPSGNGLNDDEDDNIEEYADDPDFASASDISSDSDDDDHIDKASTPLNLKGSKREAPQYIFLNGYYYLKVKPKIVIHEKSGGEIPSKAVDWALSQCERFIRFKNHEDLDQKNKPNLSASQWDQLLRWFYRVAHDGASVQITQSKVQRVKDTLARIRKLRKQYDIDGLRNTWIIKPGGKSKGIGIEFCDNLEDMLKYVDNTTLTGTYVVQKYIETPLLLYKTKFDIRQWFIVTDWNPLTVWFYKGSYLRICSQEYSVDTMHEAVHLSNVAIQQFYLNGEREGDIPEDNYMNSADFEEYLASIGYPTVWEDKVYPLMKKAVINTLLATMDIAENKKNAFELYGADFMISEAFVPWLLEINSSPGMAPQTKEKAKLCANVVEDLMRVVLDKKEDKNVNTGGFELAFKDTPLPTFKSVDNRMFVEGNRIKRTDLNRYASLDNVVNSGEDPAIHDFLKQLRTQEKKANKESGTRGSTLPPTRETATKPRQDPSGRSSLASRGGARSEQAVNKNYAKIYGNSRREVNQRHLVSRGTEASKKRNDEKGSKIVPKRREPPRSNEPNSTTQRKRLTPLQVSTTEDEYEEEDEDDDEDDDDDEEEEETEHSEAETDSEAKDQRSSRVGQTKEVLETEDDVSETENEQDDAEEEDSEEDNEEAEVEKDSEDDNDESQVRIRKIDRSDTRDENDF